MFKVIRIFILLIILAGVGLGAWKNRVRSVEWKYDLPVNIFLINADGSGKTKAHLSSLKQDDFKPIEKFIKEEAIRLGKSGQAAITLRLGGEIASVPPEPPVNAGMLKVIAWSLHMRWWSFRHAKVSGGDPQVKLFLLYFDPDKSPRLGHSTGLQKGLIGRVNVFASADMAEQNNVVVTHELLHTLGATDKYDHQTNMPSFPDGYAEPELKPLYPQNFAEIMAGRTPVAENLAVIPDSLRDTLIGEFTAREINW